MSSARRGPPDGVLMRSSCSSRLPDAHPRFGGRTRALQWTVAAAVSLAAATGAAASRLPTGFVETQVASGIASPTSIALAPDGRIFVCEQGGRLRVIKNGALLPAPFV